MHRLPLAPLCLTCISLLLLLLLLLSLYAGCVQALLTAGASVDLPMCNPSRQHSELPVVDGSTALHLAADYGHTAIASLLLHAHVSAEAPLSLVMAPPGCYAWC
jgi:hypothetical protein